MVNHHHSWEYGQARYQGKDDLHISVIVQVNKIETADGKVEFVLIKYSDPGNEKAFRFSGGGGIEFHPIEIKAVAAEGESINLTFPVMVGISERDIRYITGILVRKNNLVDQSGIVSEILTRQLKLSGAEGVNLLELAVAVEVTEEDAVIISLGGWFLENLGDFILAENLGQQ
jgi:hypothetical protein